MSYYLTPTTKPKRPTPEAILPTPSQGDIAAWLLRAIPGLSVQVQAMKLAEEVGELCGAVVKRSQATTVGAADEWTRNVRHEIADVAIVTMCLAELEGFNLEQAVGEKWRMVQSKYSGRAA